MQGKYRCHRSCSCTIALCGISGIAVRKSQKKCIKSAFNTKMTWPKIHQFPFASLWHSWNYKISYPPSPNWHQSGVLYPRYFDPSGQRYSWQRWSFTTSYGCSHHPRVGVRSSWSSISRNLFCVSLLTMIPSFHSPNIFSNFKVPKNVTTKISSKNMSGLTPLPLFLPLENSPMNWDWSGQVSIAKPSCEEDYQNHRKDEDVCVYIQHLWICRCWFTIFCAGITSINYLVSESSLEIAWDHPESHKIQIQWS